MNQSDSLDPKFKAAIERLHRLTILMRWSVVLGLWLTIGLLSLWGLRYPISLLQQYFTWAAVRYGLAYNLLPAIGLGLCLGFTVSTLIWQSKTILFGRSKSEQRRLERTVIKVQQQGRRHPLWKWIAS
jgi:hypothetical protein